VKKKAAVNRSRKVGSVGFFGGLEFVGLFGIWGCVCSNMRLSGAVYMYICIYLMSYEL